MSPDPKTVREIARKVIERASLRRDYIGSVISDHAVMAEILASGDRTAYGKLRAAVVIEQATATVTVSWPDEQQPADVVTAAQQQDGAVEEVRTFLDTLPPRIDIVADWTRNGVRNVLTAEALRAVLAERTALAARVAELRGEREADTRAVARCQRAKAGPDAVPAMLALDARFADRIAALDADSDGGAE